MQAILLYHLLQMYFQAQVRQLNVFLCRSVFNHILSAMEGANAGFCMFISGDRVGHCVRWGVEQHHQCSNALDSHLPSQTGSNVRVMVPY